jgi:hypothetical protein
MDREGGFSHTINYVTQVKGHSKFPRNVTAILLNGRILLIGGGRVGACSWRDSLFLSHCLTVTAQRMGTTYTDCWDHPVVF